MIIKHNAVSHTRGVIPAFAVIGCILFATISFNPSYAYQDGKYNADNTLETLANSQRKTPTKVSAGLPSIKQLASLKDPSVNRGINQSNSARFIA